MCHKFRQILEGKLKGRRKIAKKKRVRKLETEVTDRSNKQLRRIPTTNTSITDIAQKAESTTGTSRIYSNERDRKNKCNSSQKPPARIRRERRNKKGPLCNVCRQREELLQL